MCFNVVELKVVDGRPMHTYPNQPHERRKDRRWQGTAYVNNKTLLLVQKPPNFTCTLLALLHKSLIINGAGEWNRTLVIIPKADQGGNPSDHP
jgi:hypothetical protein